MIEKSSNFVYQKHKHMEEWYKYISNPKVQQYWKQDIQTARKFQNVPVKMARLGTERQEVAWWKKIDIGDRIGA